jgi:hypothetical protein
MIKQNQNQKIKIALIETVCGRWSRKVHALLSIYFENSGSSELYFLVICVSYEFSGTMNWGT